MTVQNPNTYSPLFHCACLRTQCLLDVIERGWEHEDTLYYVVIYLKTGLMQLSTPVYLVFRDQHASGIQVTLHFWCSHATQS
ncbi:uncharacterized protein LOC126161953 [Schistocerca cancellata]|uniref:uncharacterized protein LOC126161953 n=1 Tax=Schistocerca cancellata TaxID=274614 RepID=UPI002117D2FA|nr:uncharacterized protein LOC126161953 [Schistocerca cancellata]